MPKSKEFVDDSDSDSDAGPKSKKSKTASKPGVDKGASSSHSEETKFELGKLRYVTPSEFKGRKMVNIREYYEKDGKILPGKKGIALSVEQWQKLKSLVKDIDDALDAL